MMKVSKQLYLGFLAGLLVLAVFSFKGGQDAPASYPVEPNKIPDDRLAQVIRPVSLKPAYDFAGESLPLDNFDVRERLMRELTVNAHYHSGTSENLKKAVRFFPVIELILEENGLPTDLKYLSVAESNLSNAVSPAGAKGFWQFMKPSAQQYGLQVNSEVDERYHLEKATKAACQYFKYLHKRYGNWTNAAAAYNVGPTRFSREKGLQRMDSYYDMNLNVETGRYLFRVVAIKEVMKNPEEFGFYFDQEDGYPPLQDFKIVKVSKGIPNLGDFAKEQGTTYRMLKIYNPWLISHKLTNSSKKTYEIKIPV